MPALVPARTRVSPRAAAAAAAAASHYLTSHLIPRNVAYHTEREHYFATRNCFTLLPLLRCKVASFSFNVQIRGTTLYTSI